MAPQATHRIHVPSGVLGTSHADNATTETRNTNTSADVRHVTLVTGTRDTSGTSAVGVPHL
jgi:hypothetical protein